ncbi:glycosyltransferase [bacterium]|nr:glycosyltransferase [bacterium]MBU1983747.1 glycosyltransferase [bacterium]
MPIFLIFIVAFLIYVIIAVYLARGIHNHYPIRTDEPPVTIVIPARNEEDQLAGVLDSLLAVDYPADRLQIVVVNDFSEDRTREIALGYANRFQCRYEIHDAVDESDGKLVLKTRPLAQGIDRATGEIILMTDADCTVPRDWVRSMVAYYADGVGMVCGMTLPHPHEHATFPLTWFETLDWLFLLGACTGMSGKGRPQALIGNNYSIRRAAYEEIGTFRGLPVADIDDIVLLKAMGRNGKWKIIFPAYKGVMVHTRPLPSLLELARQRRRWLKGLDHVGWRGRFVLGFGMAAHVTLPLWPILLGGWSLLPFALLVMGDGAVLASMLRHYRLGRLRWLVPLYPLFTCLYGIVLVALLLGGKKVSWKSRQF